MKFKELLTSVNAQLRDLGLEYSEDGRVQGLFTDRTARYFRQAGILSSPEGQGSGAQWSEIHVLQLIATRVLQNQNKGVQDVQRILNGKSKEDLHEIIKRFKTAKTKESDDCDIVQSTAWNLGDGFHLMSTDRKAIPQKTLRAIQRILKESQN